MSNNSDFELPDNKTCLDCRHFSRCEWLIQATKDRSECDWLPIRFSPIVEGGSDE